MRPAPRTVPVRSGATLERSRRPVRGGLDTDQPGRGAHRRRRRVPRRPGAPRSTTCSTESRYPTTHVQEDHEPLNEQPSPSVNISGTSNYLVVFRRSHRPRARPQGHAIPRAAEEPDRELHVLVARAGPTSSAANVPRSAFGKRGAILDARAKDAYRRRLAEIDDDIEQARALGDTERAAQAKRNATSSSGVWLEWTWPNEPRRPNGLEPADPSGPPGDGRIGQHIRSSASVSQRATRTRPAGPAPTFPDLAHLPGGNSDLEPRWTQWTLAGQFRNDADMRRCEYQVRDPPSRPARDVTGESALSATLLVAHVACGGMGHLTRSKARERRDRFPAAQFGLSEQEPAVAPAMSCRRTQSPCDMPKRAQEHKSASGEFGYWASEFICRLAVRVAGSTSSMRGWRADLAIGRPNLDPWNPPTPDVQVWSASMPRACGVVESSSSREDFGSADLM